MTPEPEPTSIDQQAADPVGNQPDGPSLSIHHRDTARMYVKRVIDGRGELVLSPEEDEAIRLALSTDRPVLPEDDG